MAEKNPFGLTDEELRNLQDAQLNDIQAGVKSQQPLVSEMKEPLQLLELYMENPSILQKLLDFAEQYKAIRSIRGDGSCFYRAFQFSLGEFYLRNEVVAPGACRGAPSMAQKHFERMIKYLDEGYRALLSMGYSSVAIEDFYQALKDYFLSLATFSKDLPIDARVERLCAKFRDDEMWGFYCITFLRSLCALELLTGGRWNPETPSSPPPLVLSDEENNYYPFILGVSPYPTVKLFVEREVEVVNSEADQTQISALCRGAKCLVKIAYVDAGAGDACDIITVGEGQNEAEAPVISLLYRPGHYDVAYPK